MATKTEFVNFAHQMAMALLDRTDTVPYPAMPACISTIYPQYLAINENAKRLHDNYCAAAGNLKAGIMAGQARGLTLPAGGPVANAQTDAAEAASAAARAAELMAPAAPRNLPNPLGLEGEALIDYHAEHYPQRVVIPSK
jgi:hypothetical protein